MYERFWWYKQKFRWPISMKEGKDLALDRLSTGESDTIACKRTKSRKKFNA